MPGIQRGAREILGHDGGPLGGRRCPRGGVDGVFFPVKNGPSSRKPHELVICCQIQEKQAEQLRRSKKDLSMG